MIGNALTFRGLLSRTTISDDTFKKFQSKIEDLRRTSFLIVEYLHLLQKGIEMINTCLIKQCELLDSSMNNDMNDDKRYFLQFSMIFQAIAINFQHFNCTFESNLKEYHISTCIQLDQLTTSELETVISIYKKYRTTEEALMDTSKKWVKCEKQLSDNIKTYKETFVDPRLIYNKEEINKRYLYCEMVYHNALKEEVVIDDKIKRCVEFKVASILTHNKFVEQYQKSFWVILEKITMEMKSTLTLFCNVHKMVVSDIASKKKAFEETKIGPFLAAVPDISNEKHFFNVPPGYKTADQYPIFLQNPQHIKDAYLKLYSKWLTEYGQFLKDSSENGRKLLRRVHGFILEVTKTMERMANHIIKEVPVCYQRAKKKIIELFGVKTLDFMKSINSTLEMSMRIYQKLIKVLYQKLQAINLIINEDQKLSDMFFKEYNKQLELFNNQTKLLTLIEHKNQIRAAITQKSETVKHCLTTFGQKISKNNDAFRLQVKGILHQMFSSFNEIYMYSSEYQHNSFGMDFVESLDKIRSDVLKTNNGLDMLESNKEIVQMDDPDRFKHTQYEKIKKIEAESAKEASKEKEKEKEKDPKQPAERASQSTEYPIERSNSLGSPLKKLSIDMDPKEKKNLDFLLRKITLEEGQKFIHTFKCALYDKILLQGKLFLTDQRLCFHSYFNTANLFFGSTFLQIPKKDIVKAEKRYNAKIFDNSVSITTVNGQVFFTSFFSRDAAYQEITQTFGLKRQEKEDKDETEDKEELDGTQIAPEQLKGVGNDPEPEENDPDNMTPEGLQERAENLKEAIDKKMQKLCTNTIHHVNCLYLLNAFFSNNEYVSGGKKYSYFYEYLKESLGEFQITVQPWQPPIQLYLTKNSIKKDTPLVFTRNAKCNHTLPKSGVPFMPKFCKSEQQQKMTIVSAQKFLLDNRVSNTGAPYADTFIVHARESYTNTANGVKVQAFMVIEFLKKSIVQGIIEKTSFKEMKEAQENLAKFINKVVAADPIIKKKRQDKANRALLNPITKAAEVLSEPKETGQPADTQDQLNPDSELQGKYSALLKQNEQLNRKNVLYRYIIIGLVLYCVIRLVV